uniref:Fringe-like glycosyltransferase domain-containing protein n=1 Tax=Esox lucius TaxID=8010 RepID=A0AAY5KMA5_ESOLU
MSSLLVCVLKCTYVCVLSIDCQRMYTVYIHLLRQNSSRLAGGRNLVEFCVKPQNLGPRSRTGLATTLLSEPFMPFWMTRAVLDCQGGWARPFLIRETLCLPAIVWPGPTFIFTDGEDTELRKRAGDNVINTNCSAAHTRQALCCKMSVEYDKFIESQRKWFCHVDDDNYVIVPSLLKLLSSYHHTQDVYLGRPSLDHPIEAAERVKSDGSVSVKFWFATGGAGFCISRGLALKMSPWASLGNFISTAEKIRLPDDCTMGYIIEALLEVALTHIHLFHSHLENLQRLPTDTVLEQVTLSYGGFENRRNVVSIRGAFSLVEDPSRFKTVHCLLYPETDWCPGTNHH